MKKIDKIFKEKLANGTSPYSDQLWSKIEQQLDAPTNSKPSYPLLYPIIGGLLLTLSVFFAYQWMNSDQNNADTILNQNLVEATQIQVNEDLLNSNTQLSIPQASLESNEAEESTKESESTVSNVLNRSLPTQEEDSPTLAQNQSIVPVYSETKQLSVESNSSLVVQEDFRPTSQSNGGTTYASTNKVQNLLTIEAIPSLNLSSYNFLKTNEAPEYSSNPVDCEGKYVKQYGISMDLYFSPELAIRDLNAVDAQSNAYLIARDRSEAPTLSYSAGVRLSYHNASGFTARTGINYTQINEQFDYVEEYETTTTIIKETINPETGEINIDTTFESSINEIDQSTMNSFKSIDVPLLIGLALPINDRLDININTGVYLNASFAVRGKILSPEGLQPIWISSNNGDLDIYKTRLGLSYYGSIGFLHELSPGLDLLVEPNLRYYSQSFTKNNYPLTQDYVKIGVLTGLRYKF